MSKRNEYLSKRDLHRQYLNSPVWKSFRLRALESYGAICSKCGEHGTDVDHKTYENWGEEKLEDVQILCRSCHEAKHAIERASIKGTKKNPKKKLMHKKALWGYLSYPQKKIIMEEFSISSEFDLGRQILNAEKKNDVIRFAAKIMGVEVFGVRPRLTKSTKSNRKAAKYKAWKDKQKR